MSKLLVVAFLALWAAVAVSAGSCPLPRQPANGRYTWGESGDPPPSWISNMSEDSFIWYECDSGYGLSSGGSYLQVFCRNGAYSPKIPTCLRK